MLAPPHLLSVQTSTSKLSAFNNAQGNEILIYLNVRYVAAKKPDLFRLFLEVGIKIYDCIS